MQIDEDTLPSPFVADQAVSPTDTLAQPLFTRWLFNIEELQVAIKVDDFAAHDSAEMIRQVQLRYHIPEDAKAKTFTDHFDGSTRHVWKWKGIKVDTAGAERLFDHPSFEPV